MSGKTFFSKVQIGKESTRGTAVAATRIQLGNKMAVGTDRKPYFPREHVGIRTPSVRSVIHQYLYENSRSIPDGYYQALPLLFGCGVKGGVTATETTGSQQDYAWAFTPSLTAANSPDSFTMEMGDDVQAFEAEYCMIKNIRISGKVSQGMEPSPVAIDYEFFGRQLTPTTFTGALSLPSAEPINAKLGRFYLDTAWSGVGGTEKTNILREFDINIKTGLKPEFSGSGAKYFNQHSEGLMEITGNFVFSGDTNADAIFDAQQAKTFQVVRLKLEGEQIGSGVNHSLTLDIGGEWEQVSPLGQDDRDDNLHSAVIVGRYDSTGAKLFQATVVTNVNAY